MNDPALSTMSFADAQADMRTSYYSGATGALTSATAWLVAAVVVTTVSPKTGMITLLLGGIFIFPVSLVFCKILGRSGKHNPINPLGPLALEGTVWMIASMVIAVGASFYRLDWFFPAMLLIIGGRYLTFSTLYGLKTYWAFGVALIGTASALVPLEAPAWVGAYAGAAIEYVFGGILLIRDKSTHRALEN
ncbi:MAG: hypothetical protein AB8B96_05770 [Lysobacterales bacterium]